MSAREPIRIFAPAKVNLVLAVHPQRSGAAAEGGYHAVDTILAALDFGDELAIREAKGLSLTCRGGSLDDLPVEGNLVWRAAAGLAEALGREPNVAIELGKRIPLEAGLGGGSSDAAATLRGLCELWDVRVDDPRVLAVARELGADVAFFLGPSPAALGGRGDEFREGYPRPAGAVALVRPAGPGVPTGACYRAFDERPLPAPSLEPMASALEAHDLPAVAQALANNLAPAAFSLRPELERTLGWLRAQPQVLGVELAGSGSASFALCACAHDAELVASRARELGHWAVAARFR